MRSYFCLIGLLAVTQLAAPACGTLEDFLRLKLEELPSYVGKNNLDPTPPDESIIRRQADHPIVSLMSDFSGLVVAGYSNQLPKDVVQSYMSSGYTGGGFSYSLYFNATVYGSHATNWTMLTTPYFSSGQWIVNFRKLNMYMLGCSIKFVVLPNGYLNVSDVYKCSKDAKMGHPYFEAISDSNVTCGYEGILNTTLSDLALGYVKKVGFAAIEEFVVGYWRKVFSESTLLDIIGITETCNPAFNLTPSSTNENVTVSIDNEANQQEPVESIQDSASPPLDSVEEEILKQRIIVDKNGDEILEMIVIKRKKVGQKLLG